MPAPIGRFVFPQLRVDPILAAPDGQPSLSRLFLRVYGEELPFDLLPGNTVILADLDAIIGEPDSIDVPGFDPPVRTRPLRLSGTGPFRHVIHLPVSALGNLPSSFFWTVEADAAGERAVLGTLHHAQPNAVTKEPSGAASVSDLSAGPVHAVLEPGAQHGFWFLAENGVYAVSFSVVVLTGAPPAMCGTFVPQTTTVTLESRGPFALTLLVDVFQTQPALGGHSTADHTEGELAFLFDGKLQVDFCMRLMCALASPTDVPLSAAPLLRPQYSNFRSALIDVGNQSWEPGAGGPELFARDAAIVLVGDLHPDIVLALFKGHLAAARAVGVISVRRLTRDFKKNRTFERRPDLDGCAVFGQQDRELVLLELPAYAVTDSRAERFLMALLARHTSLAGRSIVPQRASALTNRLPALPICKDNGLDAIAWFLLANAHRGRIPPQTKRLAADIFDDDALWLFPQRADRSSREPLLLQLATRITAEYLATRAACELDTATFALVAPASPERRAEPEDLDALFALSTPDLLAALFRLWQNRTDAWTAPRMAERLAQERARRSLASEPFLRKLAEAAYTVLTAPRDESRRMKSALLNPLVIAALPVAAGPYDAGFHKEVAGLAQFAARRSSYKPGGVVVLNIPDEFADAVRDLQRSARHLLQQDLTPEIMEQLAQARILLGTVCRTVCEHQVVRLLETIDADRLVFFSDLPLELALLDGTLLCLEYATATYPVSLSVYDVMSLVSHGRHQTQRLQNRNAAILCAPRNDDDPVTQWANDIADMFTPLADLLGMDATYPVPGAGTPRAILAAAAESSLVLFAGHGFAEDEHAGLDVGAFTLSRQDILGGNWNGSVVLLFACETGAGDARQGNLASAFLARGARAVIATDAQVRLDVADHFLNQLVQFNLQSRLPLDYAVHLVRRRTVLFELFQNSPAGFPITLEQAIERAESGSTGFRDVLRDCGVDLIDLLRASPYALTFRLYGGLSERLA